MDLKPENINVYAYNQTVRVDLCQYLLMFQFVTVEAPLTNEQRKMYDTAAHVW